MRRRLPDTLASGDPRWPGLWPEGRYGGDLGFPTQSLHTDAGCVVGLGAAARLLDDDRLRVEADLYLRAFRRAMSRIAAEHPGRLHRGGGDPGAYHALMVGGLFDMVSALAPADPAARAVDGGLLAAGAMWRGLPRFDGWGGEGAIDPHYAVGWLLNALWRGDRATFHEGLRALFEVAMDPDSRAFREVTPLPPQGAPAAARLPGRCLSWAAPCVGGVGAGLLLLRHALCTELPGGGGAPGGRLRLMAGALPSWWEAPLRVEGLRTFAGPVDLRVEPTERGVRVTARAPGAEALEVTGPGGRVQTLRRDHTGTASAVLSTVARQGQP